MSKDRNQYDVVIDSVFFAQTHIHEPTHLYFNELPTGRKDSPHCGNAMLASMLYIGDDRL